MKIKYSINQSPQNKNKRWIQGPLKHMKKILSTNIMVWQSNSKYNKHMKKILSTNIMVWQSNRKMDSATTQAYEKDTEYQYHGVAIKP